MPGFEPAWLRSNAGRYTYCSRFARPWRTANGCDSDSHQQDAAGWPSGEYDWHEHVTCTLMHMRLPTSIALLRTSRYSVSTSGEKLKIRASRRVNSST